MYKILYHCFIILFFVVSVYSQKIPETEFQSLKWIGQQFQMPWDFNFTDCKSISGLYATSLICEVSPDNEEHVVEISIGYYGIDNGYPDPNFVLNLPYLQSISLSSGLKNESINILEKLDHPNQINLRSIVSISLNITFPPNFPLNLHIDEFEVQVAGSVQSDIPDSVFQKIHRLCLSGQMNQSSIININPQGYYPRMFSLYLNDIPRSNLVFSDSNFPNLKYLNLLTYSYSEVEINNSNLTLLVLCGINSTVKSANSLSHLVLFDSVYFHPMNLSLLPSLKEVQFTAINQSIIDAKNISILYIIDSPAITTYPDPKWFAKNVSLQLDGNGITSPIPDSYSNIDFYSFSCTNMNIFGALNESFCNLVNIAIFNTSISSVPDCIFCAWEILEGAMPSTIQLDPNFVCDREVEKDFYVLGPNENSIKIFGKNLGYGLKGDTQSNLQTIVPNSQFILHDIPSRFGGQEVLFSDIFNITIPIQWVTDVTNIESVSGKQTEFYLYVTIKGTFNNSWTYSPVVNNQNCLVTSFIDKTINCTIKDFKYTFTSDALSVNLTGPFANYAANGTFEMVYPVVTSYSSISTTGGLITFFGFFGRNNVSNTAVYINNQLCTLVSESTYNITCNIGPQTAGPTNYTVGIDNFIFYSTLVVLPINQTFCFSQDDIKHNATKPCSGHGTCTNGYCNCDSGYNGFYCEYASSGGTINPNSTTPSASFIVNNHQFDFNMISVQEIAPDTSVVRELLTNNWNYRNETNQTLTTLYYYLNGTRQDLNVTVLVQFSDEPRTYSFAGVTNTLQPNSLKVSVLINGWEYQSNLNTLRVVFETQQTQPSSCAPDKDLVGVNTLDNSVQYLRVIKNGVAFYGSFLPVVLSNGRSAYSRNEIINQTDSTVFFGINMPQCDSCIIDPNFSVLINVDQGCKSDSKKWLIATIVTVAVVAAIAIGVTLGIFIKKRRYFRSESRKLSTKLSKSDRA